MQHVIFVSLLLTRWLIGHAGRRCGVYYAMASLLTAFPTLGLLEAATENQKPSVRNPPKSKPYKLNLIEFYQPGRTSTILGLKPRTPALNLKSSAKTTNQKRMKPQLTAGPRMGHVRFTIRHCCYIVLV